MTQLPIVVLVTLGMALIPATACSKPQESGRARPSDQQREQIECSFVPLATVSAATGAEDLTVQQKGSACEFHLPEVDEPMLVLSEIELGDASLAALVSGEPIPASDEHGIAADSGGALGAVAVARGEAGVFRVDYLPEGSASGGAVALRLAREAAGAPVDQAAESSKSFCDVLATALAKDSLRVRAISPSTCEVVQPEQPLSVYVSRTKAAGADPADQDDVAPDAEPVAQGWASDVRWQSRGTVGTLWLLHREQQIQIEPVVVGAAESREVAISLAQLIVANGGLD